MDVAVTSDASGNVTVIFALSESSASPGVVLHNDAHALLPRMERPVAAAVVPLWHLVAVSSEQSEEERAELPARVRGDARAGHGLSIGGAGLQSLVVYTVD